MSLYGSLHLILQSVEKGRCVFCKDLLDTGNLCKGKS